MSLFVAMTNNMQIINGRKTVIERRQCLNSSYKCNTK